MKTSGNFFSIIFAFCILFSCSVDYTSFVDPSIGSGGHGHVFMGASVPFGMVQAGPVSIPASWDWCSGYHASDSSVIGFAQTHLSGTGVGDLCDIILLPVVGKDLTYTRTGLADKADRAAEVCTPSYYKIPLLGSGVLAEMTATARCAFYRFTFPADASDAAIIIDLQNGVNDRTTEAGLKTVDSRHITGYRYSAGWASDERVFFAAEFSEDVTVTKAADNYFRCELAHPGKLLVKVAISPGSEDAAAANMEAELPGWNFGRTVRLADKAWNSELGKIRIEADADSTGTIFYTSLYHTMIAPSLMSDCGQPTRYTIFSLWDTYRAQMPLYTIIHPEKVDDVMNSFLDIYDSQGTLPMWHLWGNETNCMVGNPGIMVAADAILKGFKGFDTDKMKEAIKATAMMPDKAQPARLRYGYLPCDVQNQSVAWEMEYCIADRSAYLATGDRYFLDRSNSYKVHFDPQTGFMRGVDTLGRFREPFDPFHSNHSKDDYTEGNAWQYIWLVPQDINGLVDCFAGKERFLSKLDSLFLVSSELTGENISADISGLIGQYAHGNEPSHHISYIYTMVGQPWKTAALVTRICREMYRAAPDGLCGNEDCGQMSAWYILSSLGFYQVEPSVGRFFFGMPQLRSAEISLEGGRKFRIEVQGEGRYIQSVLLNGQLHSLPYIEYEDIMAGGTLTYCLSDEETLWYEPVLPTVFSAESDAFLPTGSHIQGIAIGDDAIYASQAQFLSKIDWSGKCICNTPAVNHTGDLCWYDGELYAAVALTDDLAGPDAGPDGIGKIQVYDKDLKLVREVTLDRRTDGITCLDGVLYVGMGSKTQPSKDAHRVNILGRFDAKTLKEIAPRAEFDYGYDTKYGFQDMASDGKYIYASFYPAAKGTPAIAVFDKDLKIVGTYDKNCSNGFDLVPEKYVGKKKTFIVAKTEKIRNPASVTCTFDYWTPKE